MLSRLSPLSIRFRKQNAVPIHRSRVARTPSNQWNCTKVDCVWNVMAHAQKPRFRLAAKRTSPFKSVGASVQSPTGSLGVRISGSNAGYTMLRGSVKSTGYPLNSPVSLSLLHQCVTVCHHISTGLYVCTIATLSLPAVRIFAVLWQVWSRSAHQCEFCYSYSLGYWRVSRYWSRKRGNIKTLKPSGRDAVQFSGRVSTFWRNLPLLSSRHKRTQRRERNVTGTEKGEPVPEEHNFVHSHRTAAPVPYLGYKVLNTYLAGQNEQVFPATCCLRKGKHPVTNMPF